MSHNIAPGVKKWLQTVTEHGAMPLMAPQIMHSLKKMVIKTITSIMAHVTVAAMGFLGYTTSKRFILTLVLLYSKQLQVCFIYMQ
jgi:hypothetical protein